MVLASQSPRRIGLMSGAGYTFDVVPADIDETALPHEHPIELVGRLSALKAAHVAELPATAAGEVVIAADTIVALGDALLGKPRDAADARRMLRELSGRTHQVATGVAIVRAASGAAAPEALAAFTEVTDVTFFDLSDTEIDAYVASGEPMDKAGSYGVQGAGGRMLVRGIDGDFYNVVGLPIARVARALRGLGILPGV